MRNVAIENSQTDFIFLLDVDFLPIHDAAASIRYLEIFWFHFSDRIVRSWLDWHFFKVKNYQLLSLPLSRWMPRLSPMKRFPKIWTSCADMLNLVKRGNFV